ncbi:CPBP family intramembrane metalloprotease [Candidatus Woesearchaeota archaeon]|nr:CPBP family intramembrane metalloprotease [Candidatus Woesearchaeota archaeon]
MKKDSATLRNWILFFALITFILSFSIGFKGLFFLSLTIGLFFLAIFMKKRETDNWSDGFNWFIDFFREISVYFFGTFIIAIIVGLFFEMSGLKLSDLETVFKFFPPTYLLFFGLLAGPLEELVFRWGILNWTKKIISKWTEHAEVISLVFSSLLFGLSHLYFGSGPAIYTILYLIPTFIIGLIFGKIYLRKGLITVMWLHSLYNMFVIFLNYALIHGWRF